MIYIYIYMDGNGANSVQWFTSKKMVRPLPLVIWDQSECVVRVRVCVCVYPLAICRCLL